MAYKTGPVSPIDCSVSPLPNNLSLLETGTQDEPMCGVIHKTYVSIGIDESRIHVNSKKAPENSETQNVNTHSPFLTQAKWCVLEDSFTVLVLTSFGGYQILDQFGQKEFYSSKFETPSGSYRAHFAKGIASVGKVLCIGTFDGILVLTVSRTGDDASVDLSRQLKGHTAPICDLAANEKVLVSADEEGMIISWKDPCTSTESSFTINNSGGVPCQCLSLSSDVIIGGFANGMLRLYSAVNGSKLVEVACHSRPITALDIAHKAGLLLCASEDSTFSVWSLPASGSSKLTKVYYDRVKDSVLYGARFANPNGTKIMFSVYDSSNIITYIAK